MLDNLRTMNAETENPAGSPNTVKESNHEQKPSLPKIKITSNPHSQMAGMTLNELAQHFLRNLQEKCTRENPNKDMNQLSAINPTKSNPQGYTQHQDEDFVDQVQDEFSVIQFGVNQMV